MSIRILAGDHGFTAPKPTTPLFWRIIGWLISLFQRDKGQKPSRASHKFGSPAEGNLRSIEISEAAAPVWRRIRASESLRDKLFCVWRVVGLTKDARAILGRGYTFQEGRAYNFLRIVAMFLDHLFGWFKGSPCHWFRRRAFLPENVCSTGIDEEHARVTGILAPFGTFWREAQPDDGHNYNLEHEWHPGIGTNVPARLGLVCEQIIPPVDYGIPPEKRQRWTTWEECVDRGWV